MPIKITDPSTHPGWDTFVSSHREGSIYHSSRWNEVLRKTYGYDPRYFILEDSFHTVKAGIPLMVVRTSFGRKKLVCLPFTPYCNPLVEKHENLNLLLRKILEYQKKIRASSLEIRTKQEISGHKTVPLIKDEYFMTHILCLDTDLQKIRSAFHKSCIQRPISKTEKNDLKLHISTDPSDLRYFYNLHLCTRKKHGVLAQPYRYFVTMWDELYPLGLMDLLLAAYNGRAIAGVIILKYKDTTIYQNGCADERFLGLHPYHFLLWKAIQRAHDKGYKYFDFGRSSIDEKGLVQFKDRWGGKRFELVYYFHPNVSGATSTRQNDWKYKLSYKLIHILPTPLLRMIGSFAYRSLG